MSVMQKPLQILKLKEFVSKKGLVADTIDFEAEVDATLSFFENKKHLMEMLNLTEDLSKKQIEVQTQQVEKENVVKVEEAVKEETALALEQIKQSNTDFSLPQLKALASGVEMVCKNHFAGLFCVSNGGFGKSFAVISELAEHSSDYVLVNTHVSPIALYELLYTNNGKVILFEDCEKILENEVIISILRSALWSALTDSKGEMVRTITLHTAWKEAKHLPKSFVFTGKIILLANRIPKDNRMDALLSRVLFYNLTFSLVDVKQMLTGMAKKGYKNLTGEECLAIVSQLCERIGVEHKNLNLRLFHKAVELYRFNKENWLSALTYFLDIDEDLALVGKLLKSNKSVNEQAIEFIEVTGKSRRTFYNYRKKYLALLGVEK